MWATAADCAAPARLLDGRRLSSRKGKGAHNPDESLNNALQQRMSGMPHDCHGEGRESVVTKNS
jgi:hypothetical protein